MTSTNSPRYLDNRQAATLRDAISSAIARVRSDLVAAGADPNCLNHEIAIALARAACRFDLDLLAGASSAIDRLELVVAELAARLDQAKIANAAEGKVSAGYVAAVASYESFRGVDEHIPGTSCKCPSCR